MLNKSPLTLFVTIALVGFTAAYPDYRLHRRDITFTTIPLGKRSTLRDSDNIFDPEKAMHSISRTKSKYDQSLVNFKRNTRGGASSEEHAVTHILRSKIGSEPLTDQGQGSEWTGPASVGDPSQSFIIHIDTASSDFWIPSSNCTSPTCAKKNRYDPTKSTTSKAQPGHFSITYPGNTTVQGAIYTDTVSVGEIQVTDQFLSAASVVSPVFAEFAEDGIFGMAFPALSHFNHTPFFQHAIQQNKVASGVFGFYLADSGSELHLGGTNPHHYSGPIEYHPVINSEVNGKSEIGFWQLGKAEVCVNGKRVPLPPLKTIIDSGSSFMYGPLDDVNKLYVQVEGSQMLTGDMQGFYSFPCNNVPKISFKWGSGKAWTVTEANFNLGPVSKGSPMCVGALLVGNLPLGKNQWALGDAFMTNVYTAFDVEEKAVGFAQLR